jgi:hypothetical protein
MIDFEIDFEWPVAKYEFRPATAEAIAAWRQRKSKDLQKDLQGIPEEEWPNHLGHIVGIGKARMVRPKADALEKAVRALVECKETPFHTVALTVVRTVGSIFPALSAPSTAGLYAEDSVGLWRSVADRLRRMFEGKDFAYDNHQYREVRWPHPAVQSATQIGVFLVPGPDGRPKLALRPTNLAEALLLCAARMIATGTTFNNCENCNTPFLSGGAGRKQKRGDARFCSDKCRWTHHNEMRRKSARKAKL